MDAILSCIPMQVSTVTVRFCYKGIYYMSRKTTSTEQNYNSYELEVLAIITALKKFRVYLLGVSFKIITDCSAFEMTMQKKDLTTRVRVYYRASRWESNVDALSCFPKNVITRSKQSVTSAIIKAQQDDRHFFFFLALQTTDT